MNPFDFMLAQWNCRGANNKHLDITQQIKSFPQSLLCILLNETNYVSLSSSSFAGFSTFRADRQQDTSALPNGPNGGAAALVREDVAVIRAETYVSSGDSVSEWLSIDIIPRADTIAIRIITGYCPPNSTLDPAWLEREFDDAQRKRIPCIFAGDLNAKSPLWSSGDLWNQHGHELNNLLMRLNLSVIRSKPTRLNISNGTLTTLDLWIANEFASPLVSGNVIVKDRLTSDHFATAIRCRVPTIGMPKEVPIAAPSQPRYLLAKANRYNFYIALRNSLQNVRIPAVGEPVANLIQYREDIVNCVKQARDAHVPVGDKSELKQISFSHEMRTILERKRAIERIIGHTYHPELAEQLKSLDAQFNRARKDQQLRRDVAILREVQSLSARQKYHEAWLKLQALDRLRPPRKQTGPYRLPDGRIERPSPLLADSLLDHFTAPMSPYCDPNADDATRAHWAAIEQEVAANPDLARGSTIREPATGDFSVSQRQLAFAICNLKSFKAPGIDGVINIFYKWGGVPLQIHLRKLFNLCLGSNFSLPAWKHAAVIPVPKPGKPASHVTSQRPISLLPTDAKLLESIVARWMSERLEQQQALPENQYGFRAHRSAPDIPLRVAQRVYSARAAKRKVVACALDVQAAYDSVWHAGLSWKLSRLPLPKNLIGWITDFLRDRKLQARVAGFLSKSVVVNCGVPQGSPLSPLLYILYTADLLEEPSPNTITEAYADDLTISAVGIDFTDAEIAAQNEIDRISHWAKLWRQKFNASKSEVMPFAWLPTAINITLDGINVPQVDTLRILGLHFDPRLTWRKHFSIRINSCNRVLSWFRRLVWTPGLSLKWRRTCYISLLRSRLCYGNVVFSTASPRQLKSIIVFQNNCLRSILNVRLRDRVHITDLQQRCHVQSIPAFLDRCQHRYVENAVKYVLPIREDVERTRNSTAAIRGPISVLCKKLPPGALPPPET